MTRSRSHLARRSWLPVTQVLPRLLYAPAGQTIACPPLLPSTLEALVVSIEGELLLGRQKLAAHMARSPDSTIKAIRIDVEELAAEHVRALDEEGSGAADNLEAFAALHTAGMPLPQIRHLIPGAGHVPDLSRKVKLATAYPDLVAHIRRSRGRFSISHAWSIHHLPADDRDALARLAIAKKWSLRQLRDAAAGKTPANQTIEDPDTTSFINSLALRLGAKIDLSWKPGAEQGALVIDWHSIEDLQNVLGILGNAPRPSITTPSSRRKLVIDLLSIDELTALTEHLKLD